ncbi:MAG: hypothetical protein LC121_11035, partial [Anaerolineae bacterium]|nr:hypothetical protein [Anaerolineae bacterium]
MSRGTTTAALLAVLVALGAYIWFVERGREPVNPDAKPKVFPTLQADQVEELKVTSSKGETTALKKENG